MIPDLKLMNLVELNSYKLKVLESIKILPNVSMFKKIIKSSRKRN